MSVSKLAAIDDWAPSPARVRSTGAPAASPASARPPAEPLQGPATVADVMHAPATTVADTDHVAAAAFLMKHAGTAALLVVDAQDHRRPVGIITEADVAEVVADGRDVNDVRVHELMTARPAAIPAATSVRDAAQSMLDKGLRQLPVAGDRTGRARQAGVIGIVDIADLCAALLVSSPG